MVKENKCYLCNEKVENPNGAMYPAHLDCYKKAEQSKELTDYSSITIVETKKE